MPVRIHSLAIRRVAEQDCRRTRARAILVIANIDPESSGLGRTLAGAQVHNTGTGVSSACSLEPCRTCRATASTSGLSSPEVCPTHSASVERGCSTPSRAESWLWRYKGIWSQYFDTSTCAMTEAPAIPPAIEITGEEEPCPPAILLVYSNSLTAISVSSPASRSLRGECQRCCRLSYATARII
jgi:hypothetical protein